MKGRGLGPFPIFIILISMVDFYFPLIPDALAEEVSTTEVNSVLSVETYVSEINTDAADNIASLPDGKKDGQLKKIIHKTKGSSGVCVVTLTSAQAGTDHDKITLTNQGEFAVCIWNGTFWRVLETGKVDSAVDILA